MARSSARSRLAFAGRACFAIASLVATTAQTAWAAPPRPSPSPIPPEAREEYDRARAAFQRGDYKACVDALERAQKQSPEPRLFWNSAACEKKLGHYAKAIHYVERYVIASASSLTDAEKKEAAQFLEASRAYVARVTVISNVEGAQVLVDGELVGTTPFSHPIVVDEGDHSVRYVRAGYATFETNEKALGGAELRWAVELVPEKPMSGALPAPHGALAQGESAGPSRVGPIVLGGVGVVAAVVGTAFVLTASSEATVIEKECGTTCPRARWEKYREREITGDVLLVAGSAVVAGAVVWWFLRPNAKRTTGAWIAPGVGGLSFGGAL